MKGDVSAFQPLVNGIGGIDGMNFTVVKSDTLEVIADIQDDELVCKKGYKVVENNGDQNYIERDGKIYLCPKYMIEM